MFNRFKNHNKKIFSENNDNDFQQFIYILGYVTLILVLLFGTISILDLGGTALFRSHNTDPKIGTVWIGGINSNASEKCYGSNLIVSDGNGLSTVKEAQVCK